MALPKYTKEDLIKIAQRLVKKPYQAQKLLKQTGFYYKSGSFSPQKMRNIISSLQQGAKEMGIASRHANIYAKTLLDRYQKQLKEQKLEKEKIEQKKALKSSKIEEQRSKVQERREQMKKTIEKWRKEREKEAHFQEFWQKKEEESQNPPFSKPSETEEDSTDLPSEPSSSTPSPPSIPSPPDLPI